MAGSCNRCASAAGQNRRSVISYRDRPMRHWSVALSLLAPSQRLGDGDGIMFLSTDISNCRSASDHFLPLWSDLTGPNSRHSPGKIKQERDAVGWDKTSGQCGD